MNSSLFSSHPAPGAKPEGDSFAAVEAALAQLGGNAPGISFIGAAKAAWSRARSDAAEANRARGGGAAGELLSASADRLLTLLLNFSVQRAGLIPPSVPQASGLQRNSEDFAIPGVALLAMGSYGRRELAPFSDIDLLMLHEPGLREETLEALMGHLLRPLWDIGLQVGHATRTPQECLSVMDHASSGTDSALETATSVLEARFVAGDRKLAEGFLQHDLPDFFRRRGRLFVDAKFEETIKRWQGLSVYRTQPNLKESPGALRDYQLAVWIDQASQLSGHLPRLNSRPLVSDAAIADARSGYQRLLTIRVALHGLCRRKQDVLDFSMQQSVAEELAYDGADDLKPAENLLRDYFKAAAAVHRLAHTVTRRYLEERAVATRDIERLKRQPVDPDFTRIGDYLYAARDGVFDGEDWIEPAFRVFIHAARMGIKVGQDVTEAIRARLPSMTGQQRANPRAAEHFMTLMRGRENVATTLRSMRDLGLLGGYLPEFGEIVGLCIHDVFHDYTVDEHTLYVVEAVDFLYRTVESFDRFRRDVLEALPRPQLLRLACLFHDLGKSRGAPGHSERGALMVPLIGERLGLSAADVRTLIFLVQEHLTLSRVSQRRDLGEAGLLKSLADKIGAKERLDLLFLLTYCDSISVGHGSYPLWKDALLAELYDGILTHISPPARDGTSVMARAIRDTGQAAVPEDSGSLEARLPWGPWAASDEDRALAQEHCRLVPRRYLVEVSLEEAVFHLEALKRIRDTGKEAVAAVRRCGGTGLYLRQENGQPAPSATGGLVDMWVVSTDLPKRFSQICGAFLGAGVSVISALAYTREDHIILDHFRISAALDAAPSDAFWSKVAADVEETLAGKGDFLARIEQARRRIPRTPAISRNIEPDVRVDNKLSDKFTIVDVICGDRVGLLYGLSRALADLSCDIHFAKIATTQGLVTDVFYVTEAIGGGKVSDPEKMLNVRRLLKAVAADFQEAHR